MSVATALSSNNLNHHDMIVKSLSNGIFREYDIRGIIGKDFGPYQAYMASYVFGQKLLEKNGKSVVVGYDGRHSSPIMAQAVLYGLSKAGCDVKSIGLCPTPALYYAHIQQETDAGIMITGSHNPPDYNGMKMTWFKGPFYGDDIQDLYQRAQKLHDNGHVYDHDAAVTMSFEKIDMLDDYVARILQNQNPDHQLKIAWDAGNGATGETIQMVTKKMSGTHHLLYCDIDGDFPNHHPDPTIPEYIKDLHDKVISEKLDMGIAFDGDGDRIGVIAENGDILWGDQLVAILAKDVLSRHENAEIIADVKASKVLFDEITRLGGKATMWKTGHSLIKAKMKESKAPLAGEMSGHIFIADDYYGFDDALYTAIRLIKIVAESGKSISSLIAHLPKLVNTPEIRIECTEEQKFTIIESIKKKLLDNPNPDLDVNNIDGMRVTTKNGWWLLRASNTQNVIVARCEASDEAALGQLMMDVNAHLAPFDLSI